MSGARIGFRRARRDAGMLAAFVALVGFTVLLAALMPARAQTAIDDGAAEAVSHAGRAADIVLATDVGSPNGSVPRASVDDLLTLARELPARLPRIVRETTGQPVVTVLSPALSGVADTGAGSRLSVQVGLATTQQTQQLRALEGTAAIGPGAPGEVDVVMSAAGARAASAHVGSVIMLEPTAGAEEQTPLALRLVGIVARAPGAERATDALWADMPGMWRPTDAAGSRRAPEITVLTAPEQVASVEALTSESLTRRLRLPLEAAAFTQERVDALMRELPALDLHLSLITGDFRGQLTVRSEFESALKGYGEKASAANAQMSLMEAGVLGAGVAVLVLLAGLVVDGRMRETTLMRARGASLPRLVGLAAAESALLTAVGAALGAGAARLVAPIEPAGIGAASIVALAAFVAMPALVLVRTVPLWAGRRRRLSRAERAAGRRTARLRRLALEVLVLSLAAGAVLSLRVRGLGTVPTGRADPLVSAAPLLFALAIAVILLRVYPWPVRAAAALARRSRGALGVLGSAHAARALRVLPVLALTLAVALVVSGGLIVETVRAAQVDASWSRVGADARVEAHVSAADVARAAEAPGVRAAASFTAHDQVDLSDGPLRMLVSALAVDHRYSSVVDALHHEAGVGNARDAAALRRLAAASAGVTPTERLPALLDSRLASRFASHELVLGLGTHNVRLNVIGTVSGGPSGYHDGPFVYVDLAALAARNLPAETTAATTLLLVGPGAATAGRGVSADDAVVHARDAWLQAQQHSALVAGVNQITTMAVAAVAALALLALIASVLASARERGRSLALLRTLGLRVRHGWWLALAETAPVLAAALVGGIAAGVGIVVLVAPTLGLATLGGASAPGAAGEPVLNGWLIAGVAASAVLMLAVAMAVEVAVHRRDRLSEVLRVGGTP
ncbi:hypothetical protein OSC27_08510 [Microbacterium sp. STN6]|uniref:FtsX-like permease family protein n=1 Tax=Microbacterium sp. STN6 TaxID=2995588 RepID=UPI002260CC64|nr:FtsX-like permease family protein [Microbacterium sp. STN6]MCX7522319.1 hypothetical protein [Microbacterium sp. STN6]